MFTGKTPHFEIGIYQPDDRPVDAAADWSEDFLKIDTALKDNKDSVQSVTDFNTKADAALQTMTDTLADVESRTAVERGKIDGINDTVNSASVTATNAEVLANAAKTAAEEAAAAAGTAETAANGAKTTADDQKQSLSELETRIEALEIE